MRLLFKKFTYSLIGAFKFNMQLFVDLLNYKFNQQNFSNEKQFINVSSNNFNSIISFFYKNNYLFFITYINFNKFINNVFLFVNLFKIKSIYLNCLDIYKRTFGDGFLFVRGFFIIFSIDALITDDEPLWEPIEWSLVQTWIFFLFFFAWVAENLITSRFGSFTGRDKRVWFAWYKSFWLINLIYLISYGAAAIFVITPFYYELTYSVSFVLSWWNWYTRVFFFQFISLFSLVILLANIIQLNLRWLNWKKVFFFSIMISFFIAYLLYTHFIMSFFAYFTDPTWYQKTRSIDYIQLSQEPLKWGWGSDKRDHFTYHKVSTVFWFKNDTPFAGAFFMLHFFFFLTIFFLYLYWIILLRRIYVTKEVTYTYTIFCISSLKQFYYFFFLLYIFIFMSFLVCYWKFPIEFLWILNSKSWVLNFTYIIKDYTQFFMSIFY